jgi:hypothetical protein
MELKLEALIEGVKITGSLSGPGLPAVSFTGTLVK